MVRLGKEPPTDDAADDVTQLGDGRWRAGITRQLQASAQEHQLAAGLASGAKRKAAAMWDAERKAKRAAHMVEVRAQQKAAREAAAGMRHLKRWQFNERLEEAYLEEHPDAADDFLEVEWDEWQGFCEWVAQEDEELSLDTCIELYESWSQPYGGPREKWQLRDRKPSASLRPKLPPPPPAPDDDPDDPWGGASADCFYDGPNDHDIAERRARQERLRREQPGYVQLALQLCSRRTFPSVEWEVKARLHLVKEDYNDSYELDQERWYDDDAARSVFYGVPAGDLPLSAAAPFGFVPPSGLPVAEPDPVTQPHRDDVGIYGPLANNPDGDRLFRRDRALWYESITGEPLTGTLTERWEKADVLARSFRVDNTRSGRA